MASATANLLGRGWATSTHPTYAHPGWVSSAPPVDLQQRRLPVAEVFTRHFARPDARFLRTLRAPSQPTSTCRLRLLGEVRPLAGAARYSCVLRLRLAAAPARCDAEPLARVVNQPQSAVVEAEADPSLGEPGILPESGGLIGGGAHGAGSGMRSWPPTQQAFVGHPHKPGARASRRSLLGRPDEREAVAVRPPGGNDECNEQEHDEPHASTMRAGLPDRKAGAVALNHARC